MIAYVRGPVSEVSRGLVVVDVGGVGLAVKVADSLSDRLSVGESVALSTLLQVREDDMSLFGFANGREREVFRLLLSISGVGPKSALKVLSCLSPGQLAAAILEEDVKALTAVPGIGTKTARRLIVELSEKIAGMASEPLEPGPAGSEREALQVLLSLGCHRDEALEALEAAAGRVGEGVAVDRLVMEALRVLGERG